MQRVVLLSIISAFFLFCSISKIQAQEQKVDFTANWKADSTKNVVIINIIKGQLPVDCYIYNNSPFKGGHLISSTKNISKSSIEIVLEVKQQVYICLYKDDTNICGKWLKITE